jgi:GxxExxY protein
VKRIQNHREHGGNTHRDARRRIIRLFMENKSLTETIIGCALKVHSTLGPGLLESAYKECLYFELRKSGLYAEKEKPLPLIYDEVKLECGYRIDLLVEREIVVEIKSVDALAEIHLAQVLTYLKLSHNRFGLLMNFNVMKLKDGIKRVVNGY